MGSWEGIFCWLLVCGLELGGVISRYEVIGGDGGIMLDVFDVENRMESFGDTILLVHRLTRQFSDNAKYTSTHEQQIPQGTFLLWSSTGLHHRE